MREKKRIFVRKRGRRTKRRLTMLVAAVIGLGACAPATEHWTPAESPKLPRVDWVTFHHRVAFDPGAPGMTEDEAARLARFIRRLADPAASSTRVTVQGARDRDTRLAIRREASVLARLRNAGLAPVLAPAADGPAAGDGVTVTVGRYVASAPRCPDWSKPADGDPANVASSNFGCATATNLVRMVVDPGTLVRGRAPGPADGEALAGGIEAYRKGEAQESTPALTPLVIQSGVKGAGQ
jgi:pilus assembly protein CpaD